MGVFVVFEGVEGSGKTTQSRVLERRIASAGGDVTLVHEPGGTPTAERIRQLLKEDDQVDPIAELLLFSAARASLVPSVVLPALERGATVVCDRYIYSTLAYQGFGRGLELDTVRELNDLATGGLVPDLVVLLDLAPEQGLDRIAERPLDRIEREAAEFHRRVREGYLGLARTEANRWLVLDATLPAGDLSEAVWTPVSEMLSA